MNTQGNPLGGILVEKRSAISHLRLGHPIGEVPTIALVPTLAPSIGAQANEALHKGLLFYGNARNDALRRRNPLVEHILSAIEKTHRLATFPYPRASERRPR